MQDGISPLRRGNRNTIPYRGGIGWGQIKRPTLKSGVTNPSLVGAQHTVPLRSKEKVS